MPVRPRDYSNYIVQQWKKLAESKGINVQNQSVRELNILLIFVLDKIIDKAIEILEISGKTHITHEHCQTALRFVLPENLREPAQTFAEESTNKFRYNWENRVYPRKQRCSGLIFSLTIASNTIKSKNLNNSDTTAVFLTSVCEYICSDILEIMFLEHKTVYAAVTCDLDLQELFSAIKFLATSHVNLSDEQITEYSRRIQQYTDTRFSREGLIMLKMYTDRESLENSDFLQKTILDCLSIESLKKRKIISEETVLNVVCLHGFIPVR
jgi:hypothetical protein